MFGYHEPMPFTTLIFDFGGVLIDWNPRNLYKRFFPDSTQMEHFLKEIDFAGWNLLQDGGRPFSEGVAELSSRFPQHAELIRAYWEHWEESIGEPIYGTVAIIKKLKDRGYHVYGLSNWSAETFPLIRNRYDFFRLFDGYLISGEVGLVKPDPAIFEIVLEQTGRASEECVFIDDSPINIQAAADLGFTSLLFESPTQLERQLRQIQIL